jgi:hypothetical protein
VLDHPSQLAFVAGASDAVEDNAGDANPGIEGLVTEDQRSDAARHAARVEHQQDRRAEQCGERRIRVRAVQVEAVI